MIRTVTTAAAMSLCAVSAQAATTLDVSAYNASEILIDTAPGILDFLIDATDEKFSSLDDDGVLSLSSDMISDDSVAFFSFDSDGDFFPDVFLVGAADSAFGADLVEYLFEDGAVGYLIAITTPGQSILFDAAAVDYNSNASITLTRYTTAAIPLPASLPLVLAGLGGLAIMGRRRRTATA